MCFGSDAIDQLESAREIDFSAQAVFAASLAIQAAKAIKRRKVIRYRQRGALDNGNAIFSF